MALLKKQLHNEAATGLCQQLAVANDYPTEPVLGDGLRLVTAAT